MAVTKKAATRADKHVKVDASTLRQLKMSAAKEGITIGELIKRLLKQPVKAA